MVAPVDRSVKIGGGDADPLRRRSVRPMDGAAVISTAPGRVNLIGDHTDHTEGLVLPMAVDLATTIEAERGGDRVELTSDTEQRPVVVALDGRVIDDGGGWGRYVAGVVVEVAPAVGMRGTITTTLPVGAGLSSSAALEVAVALALGAPADDPVALARLCQRAEQAASGVPCGIMDQLASAAGRPGHALLIDCHALTIEPVPIPDSVEIVVVDSGERRALADSAYAERAAACQAAETTIGPLRDARPGDEEAISDPVVRRRARHVMSENARVRAAADALRNGDVALVGASMTASHASLRDDFEVSTARLDDLVGRLSSRPGVWGARLTGAGFGGCAVALAERGALAAFGPERTWALRAAGGATVTGPAAGSAPSRTAPG